MFKNKDATEALSSMTIVQHVIADFVQIDSGSTRLIPIVSFKAMTSFLKDTAH